MTQHDHAEYVYGCYRCELASDEIADTVTEQAARAIIDRYPSFDPISAAGIARALHDAGLLADPADRDRCHVVGCVEHIDGMHVDQVGDAIVHVGCPACRPLADPADQDELTELDRFIGAISDPLYLQGYLQGYQNGYKHAEAERDELEHRLACLLCELTGGRMSKTNYDVHTMVCEVEAYFERTVDDEVAELRVMRDRVRGLADEWEDDGPGCQLWPAYRRLRAALDGAGEQQ